MVIFWSHILYICYVLTGTHEHPELPFIRKGEPKDEAFTLGEGVLHLQHYTDTSAEEQQILIHTTAYQHNG